MSEQSASTHNTARAHSTPHSYCWLPAAGCRLQRSAGMLQCSAGGLAQSAHQHALAARACTAQQGRSFPSKRSAAEPPLPSLPCLVSMQHATYAYQAHAQQQALKPGHAATARMHCMHDAALVHCSAGCSHLSCSMSLAARSMPSYKRAREQAPFAQFTCPGSVHPDTDCALGRHI